MGDEARSPRRPCRIAAITGISVLGLVTIVGSGGGLVGGSGCLAPGPCEGDFPLGPRQPTIEPRNATVQVGASATFAVLAPDLANPSFQWSRAPKGGTFAAIADATAAAYTLAGAQLVDDGAVVRATVRGDFNGKPFSFGYSSSAEMLPGIPGASGGFGIDNWKVTVWRR